MNIIDNLNIVKDDSKRLRKSNAIQLPQDLSSSTIPKYVVYYKECYNKEKLLFRDYFKIENHPKLINNKVLLSSKSNKITILEKLEQIKNILNKLENDNYDNYDNVKKNILNNDGENNSDFTEKVITKLPKYISLKKHEKDNEKYYFIYDKKTPNNLRETYKHVYNIKHPFSQNLNDFLTKINMKI